MNLPDWPVDSSWCLFLDRDGVLNVKRENDYVKNLHELKIIEGVPQATAWFTRIFKHLFIVTNQRGVGRKIMTMEDVNTVHGYLLEVIQQAGGRIDAVYVAPQLREENSPYRKPGTGMGLQAKEEFPAVVFDKSIMVGDSLSDMEFGKKLGMKTVFVLNQRQQESYLSDFVDVYCQNLVDFQTALKEKLAKAE